MTSHITDADVGHWFARAVNAEMTVQAQRSANRRGAPETVHAHSADAGEPCVEGCVTLLPVGGLAAPAGAAEQVP